MDALITLYRTNGRVIVTGSNLIELVQANITKLTGANLTWAKLTGAKLTGAKLTGANLTGADLTGADLTRAKLTRANLTWAKLTGAKLTGANLTGARLGSPTMFLLAQWEVVSDDLCIELMRYDAANHPNPALFDEWVQTDKCPYNNCNVSRSAYFQERRELYTPGPSLSAYQLMVRLLQEKCVWDNAI